MAASPELLELLGQLTGLVALVLSAGLAVLLGRLRKKVHGEGVGAQALSAALAEADDVVRQAVLYTNQTFVEALKERAQDGRLTMSEADRAGRLALSYFSRHMSKQSLQVLTAAFGPVDQWARERIEAELGAQKLAARLTSGKN